MIVHCSVFKRFSAETMRFCGNSLFRLRFYQFLSENSCFILLHYWKCLVRIASSLQNVVITYNLQQTVSYNSVNFYSLHILHRTESKIERFGKLLHWIAKFNYNFAELWAKTKWPFLFPRHNVYFCFAPAEVNDLRSLVIIGC